MGRGLKLNRTTCLLPVVILIFSQFFLIMTECEYEVLEREDVQVEIELSEDQIIKTSRGTQVSPPPPPPSYDDTPVLIRASKEEVT